jgi:hypothetical protein
MELSTSHLKTHKSLGQKYSCSQFRTEIIKSLDKNRGKQRQNPTTKVLHRQYDRSCVLSTAQPSPARGREYFRTLGPDASTIKMRLESVTFKECRVTKISGRNIPPYLFRGITPLSCNSESVNESSNHYSTHLI